jgi:hypothetical protein
MREVVLSVAPAARGWWLDCDLPLEPTFFLCGDVAERTARELALKLTAIGRDVRVFVKNGLDQTTATHRYFSL